jgi:hypothetical protein
MKRTYIFRQVEGRTRAIEVTELLRQPPKPRVYIKTDEIPPTFSHVDCRYYTSSTKMEKAAEALGCVCVGNERPTFSQPTTGFDEEAFEREWADTIGNL